MSVYSFLILSCLVLSLRVFVASLLFAGHYGCELNRRTNHFTKIQFQLLKHLVFNAKTTKMRPSIKDREREKITPKRHAPQVVAPKCYCIQGEHWRRSNLWRVHILLCEAENLQSWKLATPTPLHTHTNGTYVRDPMWLWFRIRAQNSK